MNKSLIITIIVAVIVGAGGFFGGMKYQQGQRVVRGPGPQNNQNFRPVVGEIVNIDDKSLIVKMADGSSKIVLLGASTTIAKTSDATKVDLQVGGKVGIFGTTNSDGSVTAQSIQLNPQFGRGANRASQ